MIFQTTLSFILFLLFCSNYIYAQQQAVFSNRAAIWQGMIHRWDEANHRYSRCASIIEPSYNQQYDSVRHAGASGSLRDRLYFKTQYSTVTTNDIAFFANTKDIRFQSEHIHSHSSMPSIGSIKLALPDSINGLALHQIDPANISIVLNGFDMISKKRNLSSKQYFQKEQAFYNKAYKSLERVDYDDYKRDVQFRKKDIQQKLKEQTKNYQQACRAKSQKPAKDKRVGETGKLFKLDIYTQNMHLDLDDQTLSFDIVVDFGANCTTIECLGYTAAAIMRYFFRIGYLVMIHNPQTIDCSKETLHCSYDWNNKKELFYTDFANRQEITFNPNETYQSFIPMFSRISITTFKDKQQRHPKAFHLQEFNLLLKPPHPDNSPLTAPHKCTLEHILFYKTWRRGNHLFSFKSKGSVAIQTNVLVLGIKQNAKVKQTHHAFEGVVDFKTCHFKQTLPNNSNASKATDIQWQKTSNIP